ncbi:hypothetical protein [Micrococcus sp.]|uniref:hypothetical protein n=1 Tax=Micrococcus sp. TaxID=1271 RepID=UPI0026DDC79C|nr:hypothetical protein [Micrococcus sp.]MDO4239812.1 hypothetical protein [Micrococcus sp.]
MTAEPRRRGPRRADAAGTGPAAADGPEPVLEPRVGTDPHASSVRAVGTASSTGPDRGAAGVARAADPAEAEHDRWLREQRPPHWG